MKKIITPVMAILFILIGMASAAINANAAPVRVIGYFTEWGIYDRNYQVKNIPADKLTHINYAFAKVQNGEIGIIDAWAAKDKPFSGDSDTLPFKGNFHQLELLKQVHPHLKTLISVGGWAGSAGFSELAASDVGRKKFAASALAFIKTYGFDGVDIDWEYPVITGAQAGRAQDRDNFTLLMKELRAQLGSSYLLTAAVGAFPEAIAAIDYPSVMPYLDWVSLMSYDYHGPWEAGSGKTWHQAALFYNGDPLGTAHNANSAVKSLLGQGVVSSKIVVGMPFYGRSAAGVQGTSGLGENFSSAGPGSYEAGVLDYKDIKNNYLNKNGYSYYFDEKSQAAYLYNAGTKMFISFDDEKTAARKAKYVNDLGLGGIMAWELSGDNGDLINAIASAQVPVPVPTPAPVSDPAPAPTPAPAPAPITTPTPVSADQLTLTTNIYTDWRTGYCAIVKVKNNSQLKIVWRAVMPLADRVTAFWDGYYSYSGGNLVARGAKWNRTLKAGASTSFGFCAKRAKTSVK